jgi:hypothetical protein
MPTETKLRLRRNQPIPCDGRPQFPMSLDLVYLQLFFDLDTQRHLNAEPKLVWMPLSLMSTLIKCKAECTFHFHHATWWNLAVAKFVNFFHNCMTYTFPVSSLIFELQCIASHLLSPIQFYRGSLWTVRWCRIRIHIISSKRLYKIYKHDGHCWSSRLAWFTRPISIIRQPIQLLPTRIDAMDW